MLNKAVAAVEEENDALAGVLKATLTLMQLKARLSQKQIDLLDHFNQPQFLLVNEKFEFIDLLGAAYEDLIKYFVDSAGKKGGEVVRLLVQLTQPAAGNESTI